MKKFKHQVSDPDLLTENEFRQLARNLGALVQKKNASKAESQKPGSDSTSSRVITEAQRKERLRRLSLPSSREMLAEFGYNMEIDE